MDRARSLTLLGAAATAAALPVPARAQNSRVRIGAAANDSYAVTYFAQDAGFFERARIDADIQIFTNAQAMVQAAAGNAIDVGMADLVQVGNAYNHGVGLGFIAPAGIYDSKVPTTLICVAKNSTDPHRPRTWKTNRLRSSRSRRSVRLPSRSGSNRTAPTERRSSCSSCRFPRWRRR